MHPVQLCSKTSIGRNKAGLMQKDRTQQFVGHIDKVSQTFLRESGMQTRRKEEQNAKSIERTKK